MARRKKIKITTSLIAAVASVMTFFACIVLIVFHVRFARRTEAALDGLHNDIDTTRTELENARSSLEGHIDGFERTVSENFATISEQIRASDRNVAQLRRNTQAQFNETKKMNSMYDALLAEEKNRRIETAALDNSLALKTREADKVFDNGDYVKAYVLYTEILEFQKDNLAVRFRRVFSLFNINRLDSGVYAEILRECSVLRKNGFTDERLDEMETFIKAEQGGGLRAE